MSQIKLKHSGGNGVIIAAPSSNPAADRTITLPSDADGTIARTLDVAFKSYAIIADVKSANTDAGSSSGGSWNTRDLNTEIADADGIVSISSNQFTLQSGSYLLEASAPSYQPSRHRIKLYQTSGTAADVALGTCEFSSNSNVMVTRSFLSHRFTISTATTYEIRHFTQETKSGNGLGVAINQGTELYCVVKIYKEA